MFTLTNRLVQEDLYKILQVEDNTLIWLDVDKDKKDYKLVVRIDDSRILSYPYDKITNLTSDYIKITNLKNKL